MLKTTIGYFEQNVLIPEGNEDNQSTIEMLHLIIKSPITKTIGYKGWSTCRCCQKMNGSMEYIIKINDQNFVIPEGYIHYLEVHKLTPDPNILKLIQLFKNFLENKADSIYNLLSPPINQSNINLAIFKGLIPKEKLKHNQWYYGSCRNSSTARWNQDKNKFEYVRTKFGQSYWEDIEHPSDDAGYDIFVPIMEIPRDELF